MELVENQIRMCREQKEAVIRGLQDEENELQAKIDKQRLSVESMRNESSGFQEDISKLKDEIEKQKKANLEQLDKQIATEQELIQKNRELQQLGVEVMDESNENQDLAAAI